MTELMKIKQTLDIGKAYAEDIPVLNKVLLKDFPTGKIPYPVLWRNGGHYHFRHYGQSAVAATKHDLGWVIREIFRDTPTRFLTKYKTI